jgi:hypothetical protein
VASLRALALVAACLAGCSDAPPPAGAPDASEAREALCANGIDDDGDGRIDCGDSDCLGDAACTRPPPRSCSRQKDCGDIVSELVVDCCLADAASGGELKCLPPGSFDPSTGKASTVSVNVASDLTLYQSWQFEQRPKSVVLRVVYPERIDGTPLTCADLPSLSGATQAERNKLDDDATVNEIFRSLFVPDWSFGATVRFLIIPPRARNALLYGEAWTGPRDNMNPTGSRDSTACRVVDFEAMPGGVTTSVSLKFAR